MKIGFIGLGKMGKNMTLRLLEKDHEVVAMDISAQARDEVENAGAVTCGSVDEVIKNLQAPRVVWSMLPAGDTTDSVFAELLHLLQPGDLVVNGGNENYQKTIEHGKGFSQKEIHFIDVGVSGGQKGARFGACMMVGGDREVFEKNEELFRDLSAHEAYAFFSGTGAGHYVKMVHNGIEYGMMQAIAEGMDVLKESDYSVDLLEAARVYNTESIISSRLVGWLCEGYTRYGTDLIDISGSAGSGGAAGMEKSEAKWTVDEAHKQDTSVNAIQASLDARVASQELPSYQGKVINTLRNMFGGHAVK
jgi:6-phosphogluconate dehydrogenase